MIKITKIFKITKTIKTHIYIAVIATRNRMNYPSPNSKAPTHIQKEKVASYSRWDVRHSLIAVNGSPLLPHISPRLFFHIMSAHTL